MAFSANQSGLRNGIVLRQVVLFTIFAVVLAGGIFEFGYARPSFKAAWDHIQEIDSSATSSEFTAKEIEELFGKEPLNVDSTQDNVEVRLYRWPSGLPFRSHDIRVVYTRLTGVLAENNPDLADERYYFSASAGIELTVDNFPKERETIVMNKNKPSRAGGAPAPPSPTPNIVVGSSESPDKDSPKDDEKPNDDDKEGEDKKSDAESVEDGNKTPSEPVENPGDSGKADETKKNAEEAAPKGGEPEDAKPVEEPNPESGESGEGNQEESGGDDGAGG